MFQACDGSSWRNLQYVGGSGSTPAPAPGDGYFVLSNGAFDGNLGGLAGADALCLTDLTNNDWMGKADAVSRGILNATKVKAFLCDSGLCNNAMGNANYYYAVAGNATVGGGYFSTNASGRGPDNRNPWAAANYFGSGATYWTNRHPVIGGAYSYDVWSSDPHQSGSVWVCEDWTSNSNARDGTYGDASFDDHGRWKYQGATCNTTKKLICFVHP